MSWRGWYTTCIPPRLLAAKLKLDCAATDHHIVMHEPALVCLLAIHLYRLDVIAIGVVKPGGCDAERRVTVDSHVDVFEPWRLDQIHGLCDNRVKAKHLVEKVSTAHDNLHVLITLTCQINHEFNAPASEFPGTP